MRTGFVLLAHEHLGRVEALALHLAGAGAPVAVHVDRRIASAEIAKLRDDLAGKATVISTRKAEWGMFGLVEATLDCVRKLLETPERIDHVCLLSGTCLPVRPLGELSEFLGRHRGIDFIESVPAVDATWIKGGLSVERFTLWFPFSWKRRRAMFDTLVDLQRWMGVRRAMPEGLVPHLGLQWWCLSVPSLQRLLAHTDLPRFKGFFRWTWIPDEGFFQTVLRADAEARIRPMSLTLQRFDGRGLPAVFHDDHRDLLTASDFFFARKIDPDAHGLYAHFLGGMGPPRPDTGFRGEIDETPFEEVEQTRHTEGYGTAAPARFRRGTSGVKTETSRPYLVLVSTDPTLMQAARDLLAADMQGMVWHGRLFGPKPAAFNGGGAFYKGNLSGARALADYRPAQFLARLVHADRATGMGFLFHPRDDRQVAAQIVRDPNARLLLIAEDGADLLAELRRDGTSQVELNAAWRLVPSSKVQGAIAGGGSLVDVLFGDRKMADHWAVVSEWQSAGESAA